MLDRPLKEWRTYAGHVGIDFPYKTGTPIPASGSGRVRWVGRGPENSTGNSSRPGWKAGLAKVVVYDNGVEMRYCHLANLDGPKVGDRVAYGDTIGYVGSTGFSTGPHLHAEVWVGGALQSNTNFWKYVSKDRYVQTGSTAGTGTKPFDKNDIERIAEMTDAMIISHSSNDHRNGIVLAAPGHWHKLTGEEWGYISGTKRSDGKTIASAMAIVETGTNPRAWDLLRSIYQPVSTITDANVKDIVSQIVSGLPAGGGNLSEAAITKAVKEALAGLTLKSSVS